MVMNLSQMSVTREFLHSGQQSQAGKQWFGMKGEKETYTAYMCRFTKMHMPFSRGCCKGIWSYIKFPK